MNIDRQIKITAFLFVFSIFIFGKFHSIDIAIQDLFYDFNKKAWFLDEYQGLLKFVFYDFVRLLFHIFILLFLGICIVFRNKPFIKNNEKNILIFFLAMSLTLLIMTILKENTGIPCPLNLSRYKKEGGLPMSALTAVWERFPEGLVLPKRPKCWPAGHASIGFVFLSAFFLFNKKKYKIASVAFALIFGWTIGIYKLTFGDHFPSHNVITMILSWLVTLIVAKYIDKLTKFSKVMMIFVFLGVIGHVYTMFCSFTRPYRCSLKRIMFIQDSYQRARETIK